MGDSVIKQYLILKGLIPDEKKVTVPAQKKKDAVPLVVQVEKASEFKDIVEKKPKIKVVTAYIQNKLNELNAEFLDDD
jgi:hypothetical protein